MLLYMQEGLEHIAKAGMGPLESVIKAPKEARRRPQDN